MVVFWLFTTAQCKKNGYDQWRSQDFARVGAKLSKVYESIQEGELCHSLLFPSKMRGNFLKIFFRGGVFAPIAPP